MEDDEITVLGGSGDELEDLSGHVGPMMNSPSSMSITRMALLTAWRIASSPRPWRRAD